MPLAGLNPYPPPRPEVPDRQARGPTRFLIAFWSPGAPVAGGFHGIPGDRSHSLVVCWGAGEAVVLRRRRVRTTTQAMPPGGIRCAGEGREQQQLRRWLEGWCPEAGEQCQGSGFVI